MITQATKICSSLVVIRFAHFSSFLCTIQIHAKATVDTKIARGEKTKIVTVYASSQC